MSAPLPAAIELARRHRWQWWEVLPWAAGLAAFFLFPTYLAFGTQVLVTILFALSLDLVLGYAGIVTLGHAAFFGAGAYTVGMLAAHWGWTEPLSGLLAAALVAGLVGLASGWVLLLCFLLVRVLVYSPFGRSLTGIRENVLRMHAVGAPVRARQVIAYGISAALAGVAGAVFVHATGYVNLAVLGLERAAGVLIILILGGYGRLYGAFVGAILYMVLEHTLSKAYPTAWQLGLGLGLMAVALYARNGVLGLADALRRRWSAR